MVTQVEVAQELNAVTDQVRKVRAEVLAKIGALEEALANAGNAVHPDVESALSALKFAVSEADADIPDAE